MAYTINLYQIFEDIKTYPKTIPASPVSTHTFTMKDGCSIDKPTISFSGHGPVMATVNYAYIPELGRYYNIIDRKMTVSGVCELTLESDPIQSFWTELSARSATIKRTGNDKNGYLSDEKYNALSYQKVQTKEFPNSLDNMSYILMTVG